MIMRNERVSLDLSDTIDFLDERERGRENSLRRKEKGNVECLREKKL